MFRRAVLIALGVAAVPAGAQTPSALSGDYVCVYGCRLTDANPSIEIDGAAANCTNEFGGLFHGRLLSETSISCFDKVGVLAGDGVTLNWSDGVVWKRHLRSAR